jgi:hypothetical protein
MRSPDDEIEIKLARERSLARRRAVYVQANAKRHAKNTSSVPRLSHAARRRTTTNDQVTNNRAADTAAKSLITPPAMRSLAVELLTDVDVSWLDDELSHG